MLPANGNAPDKGSKRRLLQVSVRSLLLLTAILAIGLAIVCKRARDQATAVHRILELGGSVTYDFQFDPQGRPVRDARPPGWPWLRRLLGDEYFQTVVRVNLGGSKVTDDDLRVIGRLKQLKFLDLSETSISDDGLANITHLRDLQELGLSDSRVTNAGMRHLQGLQALHTLVLEDTAIGDEGVKQIASLRKLQTLSLAGTRVTGAGISHLDGLKRLQFLYLRDCPVDDSAIEPLADLPPLIELDVSSTNVSGAGLAELRNRMSSCEITGDFADLRTL